MLAAEQRFTLNGATLSLRDSMPDVSVFFTSMRFNRAANIWNVEVSLTNRASRAFKGPFVLLVDSFAGTSGPRQPDGLDESAKPFFDLSSIVLDGELSPGELSLKRTLSLGVSNGSPSLITRVFVRPDRPPAALGLTRTLDDAGQPLADVQVIESGPLGLVTNRTDPVFGVVTLGQANGAHTWQFSSPGNLPVWRHQTLTTNEVTVVPDPRLVARSTNIVFFTAIAGGQIANLGGTIRITFPPGAVSQNTAATLTSLSGQTLPAFLPLGWSPLQVFSLDLSSEPTQSGTASLTLFGPLGNGEPAALARWNPTALQWESVQVLAGNGTTSLSASLPGSGAYAVVVGDAAPFAPPAPQAGQPLLAGGASLPNASLLKATGTVEPNSSPASRVPDLVTATATVIITNSDGALPSGLLLRGEVREQYRLRDSGAGLPPAALGSTRHPPQYEQFIVGYQRPGGSNSATLQAAFPLRPLLLFGAEELDQATVTMDVLNPTPFAGGVLETNGGLVASEGVSLLAGGGDFVSRQAAQLRRLDPTNFTDFSANGATVLGAFEVSFGGVAPGHHLVAQFGSLPTNGVFVLVRVLYDQGLYGLQPLERLNSDSLGRLSTVEPLSGERLSGIIGAGQYLLLQLGAPQGLVNGVTRNSAGRPAAGMPVSITGQPWLAFSEAGGAFRLLAPTGAVQVVLTDLTSGDAGVSTNTVTNVQTGILVDASTKPTGPHVVSVSPTNGATNVPRVTPIIVNFSEPVNAATMLGGGLQLLKTNGQAVVGSMTLNLRNTTVTFLPTDPLEAGTLYAVMLSNNVTDVTGLGLEGARQFSFETVKNVARSELAKLTIYQPGATNIPPSVLSQLVGFNPTNRQNIVVASGLPGTADGGVPVILVNQTAGETSTVLSKPDGSFFGFVRGDEEDWICAVFVNANGTRTTVPASEQRYDDGRIGLYAGGGILEAESDGGPVQVQVDPGAVKSRNTFKVEPFSAAGLLEFLQGTLPENATLLGGFNLKIEGDAVEGGSHVAMPVDVTRIPLGPGEAAEKGAFALAVVREVDGKKTFQIVDKMKFENGQLKTASPPFDGLIENALKATPAGALAATVFSFAVTALYLGQLPVVVNGRALDLPESEYEAVASLLASPTFALQETLDLLRLGRAKPLSGAFVTFRQAGAPRSFRGGTLPDGVVYATTDQDGKFAMLSPLGNGNGVLSAFHPKFGFPVAEPIIPYLDFSVLGGSIVKNLVFTRPLDTSADTPPRLSAGHTPYYPTPSNSTLLEITASHKAGVPTLIQVVTPYSLVPGVTASRGDVHLDNVQDTIDGTRIRRRITVRTDKQIGVELQLTATVIAGGVTAEQTITHVIEFLGEPMVATNLIVTVDPHDDVGPAVVKTDPPPNGLLTLGDPITVEFDEPIDRILLQHPQYLTLNPADGGVPALTLSSDQQTLTVSFARLQPDTDYTLTVAQAVTDLAGNQLDQKPREAGNQEFTLNFHTSKVVTKNLPGLDSGGGVVMNSHFVFALDRGQNGSLRVYNAIDPSNPVQLAQVQLPGVPRDLVFIPQYGYRVGLAQNGPVHTNDLLAVVGGDLGTSTVDQDGSVTFAGQYLRVFDVSDPANPQPVIREIITRRPTAITKVRWQPPYLAYLESGSSYYEIGFINLQEMIVGFSLSLDERAVLPLNPIAGVDKNHDGDYVDDGETQPIPPRNPVEFFGKSFGYTPADGTTQKVLDFDFSVVQDDVDYVAVTLSGGNKLIGSGVFDTVLGPPINPGYRTLVFEGADIDPATGTLFFGANARPKRLAARLDARININGGVEAHPLALVSLSPDNDGVNKLAVIDISLPDSPHLLRLIPFPDSLGLGPLQSITARHDGTLALAMTTDTVLLDELRLAEPNPPNNALHPAIIGVIPNTGSGNISLGANKDELYAVNLGGRAQLIQAAPQLQFVAFPNFTNGLVDATALVYDPAKRAQVFSNLVFRARLFPARFRATGGAQPTLSPAAPELHYYVLVYAPGGPDSHHAIPLGFQSLKLAGDPYRNKGLAFPPVQALSSLGLNGIGQALRDSCDAPTTPVTAYRLSDDPKSEFYNQYLSEPFALTYERMSIDEVKQLATAGGRPRHVLWSGFGLRAFIDPSAATAQDPAVGSFAAEMDAANLRLRYPAAAQVECYPAAYIVGPNAPPVGGELSVPGTFGTINAANGEFRHNTVDMELPSRMMNIRFVRTAANQDLVDGPFGPGWDFNYNQQLIELRMEVFPQGAVDPLLVRDTLQRSKQAKAGDVKFVNGAGQVILFRNLGSNAPPEIAQDPLVQDSSLGWLARGGTFYKPDTNELAVFDLLYRFPDGEFVRLTPSGMQHFYDKRGRLEKIYHRYDKNYHVLHYNERGDLVRIEDRSVTSPRYIDIGYYRKAGDAMFDAKVDLEESNRFKNGKIARLIDSADREVKLEYNDNGVLIRRLGPQLDGVNTSFAGRPTTTYLLDEDCGGLVGITAGNSSSSPLFSASMPPNANGVPVAQSGSSAGASLSINVPANNSAANVGGSTTTSSGTDPQNNAATEMQFDKNGYPATIKMTGGGASDAAYETHFNDFGLLESVTYPEGNSTHYLYATNDPVFRSRGNLTRIEIQPGGRPPTGGTPSPLVVTFGYDRKYNQPDGAHQDFNGFTATYTLTSDKRSPSRVSYSTGESATFDSYNEYGQLQGETTVEGVKVGYGYDSDRGFTTSKTVGVLQTTFAYDDGQIGGQLGMPTTTTPPVHDAVTMEYDARLQMTRWARGSYEEKRGYDENGNVVLVSRTLDNGELYQETRHYSQIDFLDQRIIKGVEVNGSAADITITYLPDAAKRTKQISISPGGATTSFVYDHLGNLTKKDIGGYSIEYTQDRNGNLTGIKPKGTLVREIQYDGYDRAQQITEHTGQGDQVTAFSYFGGGQLHTRKTTGANGGDVENYEVTGIDAQGRPTGLLRHGQQASSSYPSITYSAGGGLTTTITGPRETTTTVRDTAGRLVKADDSLAEVTYHPNENFQITQIESKEDGGNVYNTFYDYNSLDQITRIRDDLSAPLLDFGTPRLDGRPKTTTDARGKLTTTAYTLLGEVKSVSRPLGLAFNYQYDAQRLPHAITDSQNGNLYEYDGTLRLDKITLRNGGKIGLDGPDLNNLPKSITFPGAGGGSATLTYDNLGRITKHSSSHDGQDYDEKDVKYDALGRVRSVSYQQSAGTGPDDATFTYDLLGPLTGATYSEAGFSFAVGYALDTDGTYKSVTYPEQSHQVFESRQASGRLFKLADSLGTLLEITSFKGANLPLQTKLGANIVEVNDWDQRRRLVSRRFSLGSAGGARLAELRYVYDQGFNPIARQFIHRHGRTDLFHFDDADRLDRFEPGAAPQVPGAAPRSPAGLQGGSGLRPGWYARSYTYGGGSFDLLTQIALANPDALARQGQGAVVILGPVVQAFVGTLGGFDGFNLPLDIDDFHRAPTDELGNPKSTRLLVRPDTLGAADSTPVSAALVHNARGNLAQVHRDDGVDIAYQYQPDGLMVHRKVTQGGTTLSESHFVWDRQRLIEEYAITGGQKSLRARYFYADSDAPVAADLPDGSGGLRRHFYLEDHADSVIALANEQGQVVERVHYDAFGQPAIEAGDTIPPSISSVRLEGNTLVVAFTETVMPPLTVPVTGLATATEDPATKVSLTNSTGPVGLTLVYQENEPGSLFGSVLRLTAGVPLSGVYVLTIAAGVFVDEWANSNPAIALALDTGSSTAPILFRGPVQGSSVPAQIARSAIGNPFLFQGQFFDYDTGLCYMRSRWYDPFTGHFLERDPKQYQDSPNLYAGLAYNPVFYRDPTGAAKVGRPGRVVRLPEGEPHISISLNRERVRSIPSEVNPESGRRHVPDATERSRVVESEIKPRNGRHSPNRASADGATHPEGHPLAANRGAAGRPATEEWEEPTREMDLRSPDAVRERAENFGPAELGYGPDRAFRAFSPEDAEEIAERGGVKLHVSAAPEHAETVAQAVLPILREANIYHKVVNSLETYVDRFQTGAEAGKFITIYTRGPNEANAVIRALDSELERLGNARGIRPGPVPPVRAPNSNRIAGLEDQFGGSGFIFGRVGPYKQ